MSKYVPGQKLPTPTPILLYPCQNPDCDPGYDAHDNLHSENTLFYWDGEPLPSWSAIFEYRRLLVDHGAGFYCLDCLTHLGIPLKDAGPKLAEALNE